MNKVRRLIGAGGMLWGRGRIKHGPTLLVGPDRLFRHCAEQVRPGQPSLRRHGIEVA
ncbi:hypothetical protein ACFSHP_20270 [Novosphingobium panipatense]